MTEVTEPQQMTAREELYEIAEALREADETEKSASEIKKDLRGPFMELISEIVREEIPLARQVIMVVMDETFDPQAWQKREYPEWRVIAVEPQPDGLCAAVTIEENEDYKKFEFTFNGFKYGRSIRTEGRGFDAEGFYKANEDNELSACIKVKTVTVYEFDEAKAEELMAEYPYSVAIFQKYINPGTPKAALLPIKVAKETE